ncbi:MAG: MFS transporter [Chloroflexi bacterium]|nr:MAG: MFS transporter [Chloroflexota bacterium]
MADATIEPPGATGTDPAGTALHLTQDGLWSPARRTLTLGLVLTITLVAFEALAVSTIMPKVAKDLGDIALYGWVFTAFFLGSLLGIVFVGGLIDRGGLVRPFVAGLALFSVGLVVGGLAPSMPVLVAARFLQGLGGGAIPPIAYVSIGRAMPEVLRPRMFATLSTAWVLPGVIGPALSGIVADNVGWRAVFLGLLPLILLAGAMTLPAMAASIPAADSGPGNALAATRKRFPAAILVAAGAGLTVVGLTSATLVPGIPLVIGGLALGVPAFRRLTPAGTLRVAAGLPAAVVLRGLLTFAFFCADVYVPRALQDWRGLSASVAGIALTAATLTGGAWIQARRFGRWGARRFVRLGYLTVAFGILGFAAVLSPDVPVVVGMVTWGIAGFGMGLAYSPLSLTVLAEAPLAEQGSATSGLQLSDVVGTALGTGIGGAIIAAAISACWPGWTGFAGSFAVGVGAALVGALLAVRLPGPRAAPGRGSERPLR